MRLNPALPMNHLQYDLSCAIEGQCLLLPDVVPTIWDMGASSSS